MTATTPSIDQHVLEQKIGVAFSALSGMVTSSMIHVGQQLGLYKAMAGRGPVTAARGAAEVSAQCVGVADRCT
jgi:hypothetical protein